MTFYEQMVPALSILLEIGETLKAPIYGTLLQKKRNYTFGYLGLSENAILVSLLQGDSKKLKGSSRIPFSNIQKTKVRKSLFPLQYILKIYLTDGDMIKFRISKKVYGFATQEENLDIFLNKMKTFWEYLMPQADRKLLKAIHKSTSLNKYNQAILAFFNQR